MTVDELDVSGSFQGLMRSLNLDSEQFKEYDDIDFESLNFIQLSHVKDEIENQLNILFDLLRHKYNADMDTPLVTPDGFPRSDLDVVTIRLLRIRIIRLRNDDRKVIHLLDDRMAQEFATRRESNIEAEEEELTTSSTSRYQIPFAQVREVVSGGPAFNSGLKEGDQIIVFDNDIHAANNNKLGSLVSRVRLKQNEEIKVDLKRGEERITLKLIPSDNWDGQGLLGCRLIPI